VAAVPPAAPVSPTKSKEDQAIDDFEAQYGKPPREFVAFYLNPTPENAMKWAHTYQVMLDRNTQLAIAWSQAEKLYQSQIAQGVPASRFTSSSLPPVPDLGVPIPGFTDNPAFYPGKAPPSAPILPAGLPAMGGQAVAPQLAGLSNPAAVAAGMGGSLNKNADYHGPIDIRYYFSAECPYCQKLQPDFAAFIKEMGEKVATTCIDVTPFSGPGTGPDKSNIAGKVDCTWRTLEPGEEEQFGVKETPTIIIRRTPNSAFERIDGYVPIDQLKSYIISGNPVTLQPQ
jgi:hypothetical protein